MAKLNFTDGEIASFITYRTIAVMFLALPLGMQIKQHKIKPYYYLAAIGMPVFTFLYVYGAEMHNVWMVFGLSALSETFFTEDRIIQLVALLSLSSLFFLYHMGEEKQPDRGSQSGFDFKVLA